MASVTAIIPLATFATLPRYPPLFVSISSTLEYPLFTASIVACFIIASIPSFSTLTTRLNRSSLSIASFSPFGNSRSVALSSAPIVALSISRLLLLSNMFIIPSVPSTMSTTNIAIFRYRALSKSSFSSGVFSTKSSSPLSTLRSNIGANSLITYTPSLSGSLISLSPPAPVMSSESTMSLIMVVIMANLLVIALPSLICLTVNPSDSRW